MGQMNNVFNSMEFLEPRCPYCQNKIEYGITTTWDEKKKAHKCNKCSFVLK